MVKDQEFLENLANYCLNNSKNLGATDTSVQIAHSVSESVNLRNNKLDESNRSDSLSITLTTYIEKKKSTISSSNLSRQNLKDLIERSIETTKNTPEDEHNSLPDEEMFSKNTNDLDLFDENSMGNDKKINFLHEVEGSASEKNEIINTESSFSETKSNFILATSNGFMDGFKTSSFSSSCVAVAKNNGSMERDYDYISKRHLEDLGSPSELGKNTAIKTIKKLNPRKIESEKIGIIFDKIISKNILSVFANAISASSISRGTSFLKDKMNKEIFSKNINIIDDPTIKKGLGSRNFDSEGVQNEKLDLVREGELKNYLIDTYYGRKLEMKSNGRSGGSSNLFFENGNITYDELLKINKRNLYITETIGHGTNLVTGDYSVGATGFIIEDGEIIYPVNEITIAGNFHHIFKNLTLANDLEFKYNTNSPTLLIEGMVVGGK